MHVNKNMIIKVYARRGGVTRLPLLGPSTASIYTTQTYSNIPRDHMAGLPIPTLSPVENVLALRSHMRGSIFQHTLLDTIRPDAPHVRERSDMITLFNVGASGLPRGWEYLKLGPRRPRFDSFRRT